MSTVINKLVERLRDQAKRFNPSIETAPVAVLWTADNREWEGVLPQLKTALPELFSLGDYLPDERTGPGVWLRMVADKKAGDVQSGQIPIFYLPGVANSSLRTDLRAVKDDTQLAPIAELQYRGNFWRQDNGKDWTLRAFFESKRTGLGIATKGDQHTLAALKQALPRLLTRSLATLEGRNLDLAFLDEILNPNWRATICGIDVFMNKHSYADKKTYTPAERIALNAEAESIKTESEAIAYAKKKGYKVITRNKPTHRFYFKCGEKSKDPTFNKTYKEIDEAVKKEQQKKADNPEKFKDKTEAKVWIVY